LREIYEFRIKERFASQLSQPNAGKLLTSGQVRQIRVEATDPLFNEIKLLDSKLRQSEGRRVFTFSQITRLYTPGEFESAELLHMFVTTIFEPAGEECGTQYDETSACSYRGASARQVSDLFLDHRRLPTERDIASSIAGEVIISEHLAEILGEAQIRGVEFRPVRHRAFYSDDAIDLRATPSGRRLMETAQREGASKRSGEFGLWLNRAENRRLWDAARTEYVIQQKRKEAKAPSTQPKWYQLDITSNRLPISSRTRTGADVFNVDSEGAQRCPRGDNIGYAFQSEVYIQRAAWDGADVMLSREVIGTRRGLLRPRPAILVSPRLRRVLGEHGIKGVEFEIAHFV
jgi:hypothetical protein